MHTSYVQIHYTCIHGYRQQTEVPCVDNYGSLFDATHEQQVIFISNYMKSPTEWCQTPLRQGVLQLQQNCSYYGNSDTHHMVNSDTAKNPLTSGALSRAAESGWHRKTIKNANRRCDQISYNVCVCAFGGGGDKCYQGYPDLFVTVGICEHCSCQKLPKESSVALCQVWVHA